MLANLSQSQVSENVTIPNNIVGLVIGRGGEVVNKLESETGAKIQVSNDSPPEWASDDRPVFISGTKEAVDKAKEILAKISEKGKLPESFLLINGPGEFSLDVMIEKSKIGLVIGKGGETIKSLQELTGCKMVIDKEGIYEHSQEKPMRITGKQSACMYAKLLISKELENVNSKPVSKTPSGNVTEVTVPTSCVRLIIGPRGTTVNKIQDETGCRINFNFKGEYDNGEPTRTAQLTGTPEQVEKAKIKINEVIEEEKQKQKSKSRWSGMPPQEQWRAQSNTGPRPLFDNINLNNNLPPGTKKMIIEVPASKCGSVIGKGGETIHAIKQHLSGAAYHTNPPQSSYTNNMASQLKTTEQQNALKDAMACAKEISAKLTQAAPGASAKTKDTVEPAAKKPHTDTVDHADPKVLAQQIEFSLDVMIEKSKIGLVIGKGGDILKSLQELTGCKMVLNQEGIYEHSQEKPMRITGEQSACMYAKHLISKELENVNSKPVSKTPSGNVTEVTVPKSFVGLIIGTHGTTVNKIQDETGCRIDFKGEYDDGEPTQTAQLTGTPKQVEKAKIKINEVIENEKRKQNGMPPLGTKKMIIEVPASKCASVIGKHGGTIRRIKAETHIEIQLDRSIPLSAPFGVFHVTGTERMIEDACAIIRDKTNDWTISAKPVQGQDGLPRPWGAPPNTDHSNFRAPHPSHPNGGPVYLDYVSPPPGYPNSAYTGPGGPCPHQPSPGFPGSRGPRPDYHSGPGGPPWPAAPWDTTHRDHASRPAVPWETSPGDHAPRPTAPWETAPWPVAPWDTAHREAAPKPVAPWETTPRDPAPRPAGPWEPPWPAVPWETATSAGVSRPTLPWEMV